MKPELALFLILLTIDSSISDDLAETMQQSWSHGQITLTGEYVTPVGRHRYRQQFLATNDNETVSIVVNYPLFSTVFQCQICSNHQDQKSNDSCESTKECEKYLRQIWLNYECNCLPLQTSTIPSQNTHTYSKPATTGQLASANYIQISVAAFSIMIALQIILLAVMSIGWIWTCWIVKKRDMNSNTHRVRKRRRFNNCHCYNVLNTHDNSSSEKDITMTSFLPSTNYSLLYPDNTNGETLSVDGEVRHCMCALGRSNRGMWTKKNRGKVPEGYSKLCHKTA